MLAREATNIKMAVQCKNLPHLSPKEAEGDKVQALVLTQIGQTPL